MDAEQLLDNLANDDISDPNRYEDEVEEDVVGVVNSDSVNWRCCVVSGSLISLINARITLLVWQETWI